MCGLACFANSIESRLVWNVIVIFNMLHQLKLSLFVIKVYFCDCHGRMLCLSRFDVEREITVSQNFLNFF